MEEEKKSNTEIIIDGNLYEGGGQIVRSSIALSCLLQVPLQLKNIRKARPNPGINNQLISQLTFIIKNSNSKCIGLKQSSTQIQLEPNEFKATEQKVKCSSAASITLMLQSLIPIFLFQQNDSILYIEGGTNVSKSPQIQTIEQIVLPLLKLMGANIQIKILKQGFYPVGGGCIQCNIKKMQSALSSINITKLNPIESINVEIFHVNETFDEKELTAFQQAIKKVFVFAKLKEPTNIEIKHTPILKKKAKKTSNIYSIIFHAFGEGCYYNCGCTLDKNEPITNKYAFKKCLTQLDKYLKEKTSVDEFSQDQLLIFMALAKGESKIRVGKELTPHTQAGLYVIKKFLPDCKIEVQDEFIENELSKIICIQGVGFTKN